MSIPAGFVSYADWLPFVAELAAKATLVLLLTAVVAALLWRSSAAVRHLVWCVGIVGVLALPLFSLLLPAWELPLLPARDAPAPVAYEATGAAATTELPAPAAAGPRETGVAAVPEQAGAWLPRAALALGVAGVAAGLLWLAVGFWGVSRLGRRADVVGDAEWLRTAHEAAEQLGLRRPVLLLRSEGGMPATGGMLWPVVVIPTAADAWPEDRRRAVLAHELAHVKRYDCLTQALAQVACALFWWHPAVWYAARRLRVERERACDDLVLRSGTRPSDYASHLLEIARAHRGLRLATPALVSMARPSHLESRLLWVLDAARARSVPSPRATVLTILLALLAVGSLSALRPTEAVAGPRAERAEHGSVPPAQDVAAADEAGEDTKKRDEQDKAQENVPEKDAEKGAAREARAATAAADTHPRPEQLMGMRAMGADAAYLADLRAAGLTGLTPENVMSLRGNGITGSYAREMGAAGWARPLTAPQLLSLHALRVTPEYLADLRRQGYTTLTVEAVLGLRAVGANSDYVAEMGRAGYESLTAEEVTRLRAAGVTEAYVRELARNGLTNLSVATLRRLREAGVTGEYVAQLRAAGHDPLTAERVLELRGNRAPAPEKR